MKLVHDATGEEVKVGDNAVTFTGEPCVITGFQRPTSPASTGRVTVRFTDDSEGSFYPGVVNATWIEREDRQEI